METVSMINLGGRAHSVELEGVALIRAWLDEAGRRLAGGPDRDELLEDFERAIGDKFEAVAATERDVVTVTQVRAVLASLGEVEPADDVAPVTGGDAATAPMVSSGAAATDALDAPESGGAAGADGEPAVDGVRHERRFFRLREERMVAGVCAGIAALLNLDVTVVRVLVALVMVLSGGALVVVYIALAVLVPEARTPEQKAAARGHGATAQDLVDRARTSAAPMLASLGRVLGRVVRVLARAAQVVLGVAITALLVAWVIGAVWVLAAGGDLMQAFDHGTSRWAVALTTTTLAWVAIAPLLAVASGLGALLRRRDEGATVLGEWGLTTPVVVGMLATWLASIAITVLVPIGTSAQLRGVLPDGQGRIHLFDHVLCFTNAGESTPNAAERCHAGDDHVRVDGGEHTFRDGTAVDPLPGEAGGPLAVTPEGEDVSPVEPSEPSGAGNSTDPVEPSSTVGDGRTTHDGTAPASPRQPAAPDPSPSPAPAAPDAVPAGR